MSHLGGVRSSKSYFGQLLNHLRPPTPKDGKAQIPEAGVGAFIWYEILFFTLIFIVNKRGINIWRHFLGSLNFIRRQREVELVYDNLKLSGL